MHTPEQLKILADQAKEILRIPHLWVRSPDSKRSGLRESRELQPDPFRVAIAKLIEELQGVIVQLEDQLKEKQ